MQFIDDDSTKSSSSKLGQQPLRERLAEGEWFVVLYRHGCPRCHAVLAQYKRDIEQHEHADAQGFTMAIIETSFHAKAGMSNWCDTGRLSNKYRWFFKAPIVIHLRNGVVQPDSDTQWDMELETLSGDPFA